MINNRMCIADAILDYAAAHSNGSFVMNDASNDPDYLNNYNDRPYNYPDYPDHLNGISIDLECRTAKT